MSLRYRSVAYCVVALMLTAFGGEWAKAQAVDPLVVKMAANENEMLRTIGKYTPLVETYLQIVKKSDGTPVSDHYWLHRIELNRAIAINDTLYNDPGKQQSRFTKAMSLATLSIRRMPMSFSSSGFVEMLSPDIHGFDPKNYAIEFLHNEFLGGVRVAVYEVTPAKKTGYFRGRFWIDGDGHLVRFIGAFTTGGTDSHPTFTHFDSWRYFVNGMWLPAATYIEQTVPDGVLHGQIRIWGYGLEEKYHEYSSTSVTVSVDNAVDHSTEGVDVDQMTAMQEWKNLATDNIIDRMSRSGVLAPKGSFDKILDQIVVNLSIPNNLTFAEPVHCRIMLTTPIEATTVGNTILLSKGLIETLPNEESIASVIAFELAHLSKKVSVDTQYAFADSTLFANKEANKSFALGHSVKDDDDAARAAVEMLKKSMYADKLDNVSLYYQQMSLGVGKLRELYHPAMGDSLISLGGRPWLLAHLEDHSPRLEPDNPRQLAALPLGSNLVVDPWSSEVRLNDAPRLMPLTGDDKHPFAVVPVYFRLRFTPASAADGANRPGETPTAQAN